MQYPSGKVKIGKDQGGKSKKSRERSGFIEYFLSTIILPCRMQRVRLPDRFHRIFLRYFLLTILQKRPERGSFPYPAIGTITDRE
jgi:hypothetical protein